MLNYSFNTVLIAIITSNLIIILITLCFLSEKILKTVGYKLLMVFLFLTLVRFLFPFEIPGLTKNLYLPGVLSLIIGYIRYPFVKPLGIWVSLWSIFEFVWLIGGIKLLIQLRTDITIFDRGLALTGVDVTTEEPYASVLQKVCGKRKNPFRILRVPLIPTPQIYGIKHPCILLPQGMKLTEEDLYYVLRHETSHYYHHDLLLKRVITFLTIFYWWNPICSKWFKRQTKILLEMRVDASLVKGDKQVADAYMHTLVRIAEYAEQNSDGSNDDGPDFVLSMVSVKRKSKNKKEDQKKQENTVPRFQMMCREHKPWYTLVSFVLFVVVITMYLGSYLIAIENDYTLETNVVETYATSDDGFYAIIKEDETYDIYYFSSFLENVESLDYYPPDIPIYNE